MQILLHYKPRLEFFPSKRDNGRRHVFCTWRETGLTFFTKPIAASIVLKVLTSNRSRCGGEESGYTEVWPRYRKKNPPAMRASVNLVSGHASCFGLVYVLVRLRGNTVLHLFTYAFHLMLYIYSYYVLTPFPHEQRWEVIMPMRFQMSVKNN